MTKHYLGLDAGGTKTFCLVGDDRGNIVGFGRAGTGNYETKGIDHARQENRTAVEGALAEAGLSLGDISGIGMGIAGADIPEDYEMLDREIYRDLLGNVPRDFQNDSMGGLRGGTRRPYGIVVACGTGCVCAGRNKQGEHSRSGGLGLEFGDECSGTDIGRIALRRVWQARDQVIPPTLLTKMFVERSGCADVDALFSKVYRGEIVEADLQPMAKIVFDAALGSDSAACAILSEGGRYLGAMANSVARKLNMTRDSFELVMAGSVFKGSSPVLVDSMRAAVHEVSPRAELTVPAFEPVVGTLLMGMEIDMAITDTIYRNLTDALSLAEVRYGVPFKAR
jgi:N-acetylglucosamine kinase-like BadF-type ATPase